MSEDKKFKLDELPEKGGQSVSPAPLKKRKITAIDPRISELKTLDDSGKVEAMGMKWKFDAPDRSYSWLIFVLILGIIEFTPFYESYINEISNLNKSTMDLGGALVRSYTVYFEFLIKHPGLLIFLLPFFMKFSTESEYHFEINFDGINTVKEVLPRDTKLSVHRTFIKWREISRIERSSIDQKEILKVYSQDGHIGEIIWYIDIVKKRVIKNLILKLVSPNNPLREFLEKEKELM
jgi:hypothetical protein